MIIRTNLTPNPNAMQFFPGIKISMTPIGFHNIDEASISGLAYNLLILEGVKLVFFGSDFITISKIPTKPWETLKPEVIMTILEHLSAGFPIFRTSHSKENTKELPKNTEELAEIEQEIIAVLNEKIKPAVAQDGGDVEFIKFDDGIVYLSMHGACQGCPSASVTLKRGIFATLKHYIPEVKSVEECIN